MKKLFLKFKNLSTINKTMYIIITVAIITIIYGLIMIIFNSSSKDTIVVYTNTDHDLKYVSSKSNNSVLLAKTFEEKIKVKFNIDKSKLAYIKNNGLYIHDIDSTGDSNKIGVDVVDFVFIGKNEILYLDVDKNLYVVSSNNKNRIDIDVTYLISAKKDKIIYSKGEDIYLYDTKTKEKNKILNDYDFNKKLYVSKNIKQILYVSKNKKIKLYDIGSRKTSVKAEDVYDIATCSDDFSTIAYTKLGEKKRYYDLLVNDKPEDNPIEKYNCEIYTFDVYFQTTYEFKNSDPSTNTYYIYESIDGYIYFDEKGQWSFVPDRIINGCNGVDPNAELKDQIRNDQSTIQLYDIYLIHNKENKEMSKNVYEVIKAKDDTILYTKLNINDEYKIKISSLKSVDELKTSLDKVKPTLYFTNNSKTDELLANGFDTKYKKDIDVVNSRIYAYELNDKNELSLYEYNTEDNNKEKISSKGFILDTNKAGFDIIYLDNYDLETLKGDLIGRRKGNNTEIDTDVYSSLTIDKKNLYYYKDFDFKKLNGTYIINNLSRNKKEKIDDISIVLNGNNSYYVFKDYSTTSKTYSLFYRKNGIEKPIEYNVTNYVYSK